jgi:hypothetical protein
MNTQETRMIEDAIFDLQNGYSLAALSVLRALQATGVPKVLLKPMSRETGE